MSEVVTTPVKKRCETGRMPAWMRKMKKSNDYSCVELAEAVTSLVTDKRKRARKVMAGSKKTSVLSLYGGDDWTWILATENDTRLRGLSGDRYLIDPTAHMAALPTWTKVLNGHIDHNLEKKVDIDVGEARYDIDKGLYLKVRTNDDDINRQLKRGDILPSIEVDVESEDVLDKNIIDYYVPTGLGLMKDNEPLGNSVGPEKPSDRFSVPIYAGETNMTKEKETVNEEEKTEDVEAQAEPAAETPAEPETVEEPKEEESVDELTQATTKVAELEKRLEEVLNQVDSKASAETELKKIYLDKIPESIHSDVDNLDLTTLKAFAKLSDHFQTQIEDTTRLEEAPVINETDTVGSEDGFNSDGSMSDKLYYSLKIKNAKANGMKYPKEWETYLTV
jgi:hypothetical protein|tara:strand:+ start:941 stop:2116 length:1176 start_codon:yes stop_codon:yes gene_type:complete